MSWNTCALLRKCITSLFEQITGASFEVVVVDNDSGDGTCDMIEREFPQARLIRNSGNNGFARGCNQAMVAARGRHFLLLNSDTWLTEDAVSRLVRFMDDHPTVGASGCMLRWPDGRTQPSCGWFPTVLGSLTQGLTPFALFDKIFGMKGRFAPPFLSHRKHYRQRDVDWIVGACILVRRETVDQVGMIDDDIFMFGEESEWCFRMKAAGWRVVYTPETHVVHVGCASWNLGDGARVNAVLSSQQFFFSKYYGRRSGERFRKAVLVNASIKSLIWRVLSVVCVSKRETLANIANWHMHALTWYFNNPVGRLITAADIEQGTGGRADDSPGEVNP